MIRPFLEPTPPTSTATAMTAIARSAAAPAAADPADEAGTIPAPVLAVLVDNRARFLAFLEKRVGGREAAEEILQQAYVRGMDRGGGLRADESAIAWFYRLLRNALADHWRRCDAERRALAAYAGEASSATGDDGALLEAVCGCVTALVETLKPELAAIIRAVDLEGEPLRAYAARTDVSANNAAVRLHRARRALGQQLRRTCAAGSIAALRDCDCDCAGPA
jgi:RNA polymerase sigma-70 factor (ECF subfamily)